MKNFYDGYCNNSQWISVTPTAAALAMPFYMTEVGCFCVHSEYKVIRNYHDSFLLLYTINGKGIVRQNNTDIELLSGNMVIIDCHKPHEYYADGEWTFMWMHFSGANAEFLMRLIYPEKIFPSQLNSDFDTDGTIRDIMLLSQGTSVVNASHISLKIHSLYTALLNASASSDCGGRRINSRKYVEQVTNIIKTDYSKPMDIDSMLSDIPMSKYHFIRIFKRIVGVTPYNYLLLYRINKAKEFLRTTDKPISEISELCGFLDVSNFIDRFKKHTNQTPLKYRRMFPSL